MTRLIEPKKRVPQKLVDNPVAHAFGFDRGDLQDNRMGFISHWQKKRLRWHSLSYTWSVFLGMCIFNIVPLFFLTSEGMTIITAASYLWIATVLIILGAFWIRNLWTVIIDMRRMRITSLTGTLKKHRLHRKKRRYIGIQFPEHTEFEYFIRVNGQRFAVSRDQFNAFRDERAYTLYISQTSRQILSAEALADDDMPSETTTENIAYLVDTDTILKTGSLSS